MFAPQLIRQSLKRVMDLLNLPGHKRPPITVLNLGMAWDGISSRNPEWITRSEFQPFEKQITQLLFSERAIFQEQNSIKGFGHAPNECNDALEKARAQITQFQEDCRRFTGTIKQCLRLVNAVNYQATGQRDLASETDRFASEALSQWRKHAENEATALKESTSLILKEHGLPELPKPSPPTMKDMPPLVSSAFEFEPVTEKSWVILHAKYDAHETADAIEEALKRILRAQDKRVQIWTQKLMSQHLSGYCEHRRGTLVEFLTHLQTEYERKKKPDMAQAEKALGLIKTLQEGLHELSGRFSGAMESIRTN